MKTCWLCSGGEVTVTHALSEDQVRASLIAFVRERFLFGDPKGELDETTPLLEWGILDSLNTAILIGHIREEFGTAVPTEKISKATFENIRSITSMLCSAKTGTGT
jgi:peptidyl carrier protein